MLPENASAPEVGHWEEIGSKENQQLIKQWEVVNGRPWPRMPDGSPYDVSHIQALADGGKNVLSNIEPKPHADHMAGHAEDFSRWGKRPSIAKAFGGRVEPYPRTPVPKLSLKGLGVLSVIPDVLGILTGRIRTDSFENFVNDMTGQISPADWDRMAQETCRSLGINDPEARCI